MFRPACPGLINQALQPLFPIRLQRGLSAVGGDVARQPKPNSVDIRVNPGLVPLLHNTINNPGWISPKPSKGNHVASIITAALNRTRSPGHYSGKDLKHCLVQVSVT